MRELKALSQSIFYFIKEFGYRVVYNLIKILLTFLETRFLSFVDEELAFIDSKNNSI